MPAWMAARSPSITRCSDAPAPRAKAESRAILEFLYQHASNPDFQVRFRWKKNSVAFWDNRCTWHQAIWDYFPDTRTGFRVTVAGDKPV